MFTLATALDSGDPPNPWPAGIPDTIWWLALRCVELGGQNAGIYADKPHFHNTVAHNLAKWPDSYSIALPILLLGPHDKARAFDWEFVEAQSNPPDYGRINKYSARLLAACQARDPRLRGLYEWFGTRDGANIGYNNYKNRPSSSNDTHDWHIHFSIITAYVLVWATVHGILSVLIEETLEAYLARGGQLIEGTDMTVQLDPNDPEWSITSTRVDAMMNMRDKTLKYGEDVPLTVALKRLVTDVAVIKEILVGSGSIEITDAQAALIGTAAGRKVLETLAGAEEVAARVLREGAGGQ